MKWRTIGWLYGLALLAIASAIYRLALMAEAFATGKLPVDPGDLIYVQRWVTPMMHLVTGLAFMILGPLQFSARLRQRWPAGIESRGVCSWSPRCARRGLRWE